MRGWIRHGRRRPARRVTWLNRRWRRPVVWTRTSPSERALVTGTCSGETSPAQVATTRRFMTPKKGVGNSGDLGRPSLLPARPAERQPIIAHALREEPLVVRFFVRIGRFGVGGVDQSREEPIDSRGEEEPEPHQVSQACRAANGSWCWEGPSHRLRA